MTPEEFANMVRRTSVWIHIKTGNRYLIQNYGKMKVAGEWVEAVVYSNADGDWFCRESKEFCKNFRVEKT